MRVGVLLFSFLMAIVPAMATGSHGGGRSSGGHSYSHASRSHSYSSRSSRSSYRTHASTYRSRPAYSSHRSYGTRSYGSRRSSAYSTGQRDSHGRIHRSAAAKDTFKRQHPCPSTGRQSGACPGYVIDHVKPLANGGADAPSNMQWQTKADAKAKDKWERKR